MYQLCIVKSKSTEFESQFDEIETINLKVAYQRRKRWYAKRTIDNKNIHTKLTIRQTKRKTAIKNKMKFKLCILYTTSFLARQWRAQKIARFARTQ